MAAEKVRTSSTLQLVFNIDEGMEKPKKKRKTLPKVKGTATPTDLYDIAVSLAGLQQHIMGGIYLDEKYQLIESI